MGYNVVKIKNILDTAREGFSQGFRPTVWSRAQEVSRRSLENHGRECFK